VEDYDVFSTNIRKAIKYIKNTEDEKFIDGLWNKYFSNFNDLWNKDIFLVDKHK
jgi:uncharacterized protein (UPF0305 family)